MVNSYLNIFLQAELFPDAPLSVQPTRFPNRTGDPQQNDAILEESA